MCLWPSVIYSLSLISWLQACFLFSVTTSSMTREKWLQFASRNYLMSSLWLMQRKLAEINFIFLWDWATRTEIKFPLERLKTIKDFVFLAAPWMLSSVQSPHFRFNASRDKFKAKILIFVFKENTENYFSNKNPISCKRLRNMTA